MGDEVKSESGFVYELYGSLFAAFILGLWISFIVLSDTDIKTFYGPLAASCIRWAYGIMEISSLKLKVDRRSEEAWLTTFHHSNGISQKKVNKYSLLQYSVSQIVIITVTGIIFVALGVSVLHQQWIWLLGVTMLTELATRLAIEVIWRKLRLGGKLQRLLNRWREW